MVNKGLLVQLVRYLVISVAHKVFDKNMISEQSSAFLDDVAIHDFFSLTSVNSSVDCNNMFYNLEASLTCFSYDRN